MKIKNKKLTVLLAGLGILCLTAILIFYTHGRSPSVDPLLSQENAGYQIATVNITADGFEPEHIEVQAGTPTKIDFKKSTRFTCIKSIGSQYLGIDVPFDKGDNFVTLADLKPGTYEYHCGMYMYYGTVTVK